MRREEVLNRGSKQLETSGKPNSPTNWSINSTNRNVPRGHDLWSAATTHLIRREIPRVAHNPKTFHLLWSSWHVTTTTKSGGSWWDWRSQLQMNLIRQTRPFSKMSLSKCPCHWQGHQDYLIPPIMPRTVTKPAMQIVRSTLKPQYWAEGVTKEGINTTIPPTTARIQGNTYKALTLPTEGRETHWEIFLALLHCIIFS